VRTEREFSRAFSMQLRIEDGSWVRALGTTTWSIIIDTTPYPNGAVNVTFHAFDGEFDLLVVRRYVINNPVVDTPPTVDIVTPTPGATVRGDFTLGGTANDPEGNLTSVEYRESGGAWKRADLSGTSWTVTVRSGSHANGPFLIEVRAFDGQNYSEVAAVTVIADNPPSGGGFLPGLELASAVVALGALALGFRFRWNKSAR